MSAVTCHMTAQSSLPLRWPWAPACTHLPLASTCVSTHGCQQRDGGDDKEVEVRMVGVTGRSGRRRQGSRSVDTVSPPRVCTSRARARARAGADTHTHVHYLHAAGGGVPHGRLAVAQLLHGRGKRRPRRLHHGKRRGRDWGDRRDERDEARSERGEVRRGGRHTSTARNEPDRG